MFRLFKKKTVAEVPPKKDFAEELKDLFIIRTTNAKCDKCELETDKCKKLIFADRTICVVPKEEVNNFIKVQKRKYKKNPK
jgi:hypothetical protein